MDAVTADTPYEYLLAPPVLLFGDDPARRAVLADAIVRGGGRVVAEAPIAGAIDRIARQAALAGVVVDAREDGGTALDTLLIGLDLSAATGRAPNLVLTTHAMIDLVTARIVSGETDVLIDPSEMDVDAAILRLLQPRPDILRDSADTDARLVELREEVGRIARTLAALSGAEGSGRPALPVPPPSAVIDGPLLRTLIRLRRLRGQHFDGALFADPAWDILLDLAAARIERRSVAISSLCIAAAVPATTALRWITQMTEQRLLVRRPDPDDGRRVFIGLSEESAGAMEAYLGAVRDVIAPEPPTPAETHAVPAAG